MMEDIKIKNPRKTNQERVSLRPEALERINAWMNQLSEQCKGIALNRSDLVNWLINHHNPVLTKKEVDNIRDCHFDDVEFAAWALRELKAARTRGERVTLEQIILRKPKVKEKKSETVLAPAKTVIQKPRPSMDSPKSGGTLDKETTIVPD
jgi:hypothetical protein